MADFALGFEQVVRNEQLEALGYCDASGDFNARTASRYVDNTARNPVPLQRPNQSGFACCRTTVRPPIAGALGP